MLRKCTKLLHHGNYVMCWLPGRHSVPRIDFNMMSFQKESIVVYFLSPRFILNISHPSMSIFPHCHCRDPFMIFVEVDIVCEYARTFTQYAYIERRSCGFMRGVGTGLQGHPLCTPHGRMDCADWLMAKKKCQQRERGSP